MGKRQVPGDSAENKNKQITEFLSELADYEKNVSRNVYKSNAYRKAAGVIAKHPEPIRSGDQARKLDGVGDKISKKIQEFLDTGKLSKLEKIRADDTSIAIKQLTRVSGIGPMKAKELLDEGITTIDELKKHEDKLTHHQKIGLKHVDDFEKRIPRDEIKEIEKILKKKIAKLDKKFTAMICGSYRRGAPTSGDIDLLLTHEDHTSDSKDKGMLKEVVESLESSGLVTDTISLGDSKFMGVCRLDKSEAAFRRLDIMLLPIDRYYCGVLYFTGSDMFNKAMRQHAIEQGFTLNEYTLRPIDKAHVPLEPLPISCEEDIFDYISFEYKSPEERSW